jgi:modification methylase
MPKLICGNSKNMKELKDESVHLVITSPPYYDLKDYSSNGNHTRESQIGSPNNYQSYLNDLNEVWDECLRVLVADGKLCINIMPVFLSGNETTYNRRVTKTMISDFESHIYETEQAFLHSLFIWDKRKSSRFSSFGSYPYPPNIFSTFPYEWIVVFSKKGKRINRPTKDIKEKSKLTKEEWANWAINSFWEMSPEKATKIGHPAPFPEELPRRLIKLYSFWGDTILDPFVGSGTTVKVAEDLGRKGIGYDINPDYIKLSEKRLAQKKLF